MNSAVEDLGILAQALVEEQREEERRLAAVLEKQSLRIRKAEGLTWAPVTIETQQFTFGGRVKLTLQKGQNGGLDDAFRSGSPVHFYKPMMRGCLQMSGPFAEASYAKFAAELRR